MKINGLNHALQHAHVRLVPQFAKDSSNILEATSLALDKPQNTYSFVFDTSLHTHTHTRCRLETFICMSVCTHKKKRQRSI